MLTTPPKAIRSKYPWNLVGPLFLLSGLAFLAGCQGISAVVSSTKPPSSTLSLLSTAVDFGIVAVGSSKTLTVTATNSGSASVTVTSATISTSFFSLISPSLPITVAAGQSTVISIQFTPNAAGTFNATLSITSDASNGVTNLALSGTGAAPVPPAPGALTASPTTENFGSVIVGANQPQSVTLTNTGGSSVNISQATVSGAGFQLSGITTPLTLNPAQSMTFTVAFTPQTSGNANGTVTITSNAANPSTTIALSGVGVAH